MRDTLKLEAEEKVDNIIRNQTCTIDQRIAWIMLIVKLAYQDGKQDAMNKPGGW